MNSPCAITHLGVLLPLLLRVLLLLVEPRRQPLQPRTERPEAAKEGVPGRCCTLAEWVDLDASSLLQC